MNLANKEALGSFPDAWGKAAGLGQHGIGADLRFAELGESISAN